MIAKIFIILLTLVCSSCQKKEAEKGEYAEYIDYVRELEQNFAKQIEKELNLKFCGISGKMHEKIEEMFIQFNVHRRATVEEARALHLLIMDRFVKTINTYEKIQPFLAVRPFTYKRVKIIINYAGINGPYCDGTVEYTSNVTETAPAVENRNHIFYDFLDPFQGSNSFKESYEEAVRLNEAAPNQNPIHQITLQEKLLDQLLYTFSTEMHTEFGLECWRIGGKMTQNIEEIGGRFIIQRQVNQEGARKMGLLVAERLLKALNSSEALRPFLKEYPFPSSRLRLLIYFRNKRGYNYRDGSMESISLDHDEITYFQEPPSGTDPYPTVTPVFAKESYQDALKLFIGIPLKNNSYR